MSIQTSYRHTRYASYLGYVTQAIINNFAPLLFLTFQSTYQIPLEKITLLVTINFGMQLLVDFAAAHFVDRIGYRTCVVAAHIFAGVGLMGLGLFPPLFADPYHGLLLAISLYAVGGGVIEVLISPIVEACPTEKKSASMSLLHSFYCWGHLAVVLLSTLFFVTAGIGNWRLLAFVWAAVPLLNALYFTQVPIATLNGEQGSMSIKNLISMRLFWVFVLLMACSGASELAMSQWASAFAESGLSVSKTMGDLAGPAMFAMLMGVARVFYAKFSDRLDLMKMMLGSGVLCILSYLLAALSPYPLLALLGCALCGVASGMLWPGTLSLASARCPSGGTAMFAFLALAGDLGCSTGPTVVGLAAGLPGGLRHGLLFAIVFPVLLIVGLLVCKKMTAPVPHTQRVHQN